MNHFFWHRRTGANRKMLQRSLCLCPIIFIGWHFHHAHCISFFTVFHKHKLQKKTQQKHHIHKNKLRSIEFKITPTPIKPLSQNIETTLQNCESMNNKSFTIE